MCRRGDRDARVISEMTRRGYFGVGFAVLVGLALADVAYTKPEHTGNFEVRCA